MKEILGNKRIISLLRQTVVSEKPAHAYLFVGREGIGKRKVATRFAAMLNCPKDHETECSCPTCTAILEGRHPDFTVVTPDKNIIRIDKIRAVQNSFKYAPVEAYFRIAVFDDAHTMNKPAQNALLKLLEEPPPARILILVSSKPGTLLSTIRSRCRVVRFAPLAQAQVINILLNRGVNSHIAESAAALSAGSASQAIDLATANLDKLRKNTLSVLSDPTQRGISGILQFAAELSSDRETALNFLELAKSWVRDLIIDKFSDHAKIHSDNADLIRRSSEEFSYEQLMLVYDELMNASKLLELEYHINRNLIFDMMLFRIARILKGPNFGLTVKVQHQGAA